MRRAVALALVASLACMGGEPVEAISFDVPIEVSTDAGVRWASDGGVCLTPKGWDKVDTQFRALQVTVSEHKAEPSPQGWFFAGVATGGVVTAAILGGLYLAFKK